MNNWRGKKLGQKVVVNKAPEGYPDLQDKVGRVVGFTRQPQDAGTAREYGIDVEFSNDEGFLYSIMLYHNNIKKAAK